MAISTWDPAFRGSEITLSGGDLIATHVAGGSIWAATLSNTFKSSGKVYAELLMTSVSDNGEAFQLGFAQTNIDINQYLDFQGDTGWLRADMSSFDGGANGTTFFTANRGFTSVATGNVVGIAFDFTAGKAWFAKNNTFGGSPAGGTSPAFTWTPGSNWRIAIASYVGTSTHDATVTLHADYTNQTYTPPSGFDPWDGAAPGGGVALSRIIPQSSGLMIGGFVG